MPVEVITEQDLLESEQRILAVVRRLIAEALKRPDPSTLLKPEEVRAILKISPRTLQRLRRDGVLNCTRIRGTPYYDYREISLLINKH